MLAFQIGLRQTASVIATDVGSANVGTGIAAPEPPLNADVIATLPATDLDALLPEGRAAQPEQSPFAKLPGGFSVGDWFKPPQWRGTIGDARGDGGELMLPPDLKQLATGRAGAAAAAAQPELGPVAITRNLLNRAREAGLSKSELAQLEQVLNDSAVLYGTFDADARTVAALLDSENAVRGLRTYIDLEAQSRIPGHGRLAPEITSILALGVGRARSENSEGREGILSEQTALAAAEAVLAMSPEEYQRLVAMLHAAGGPSGPIVKFGADAQTEQALILKAVGASLPPPQSSVTGVLIPSDPALSVNPALAEMARADALEKIERFAGEIRGMNAHTLIERTSGIDVDGNGGALAQNGPNGSEAAVLQMAAAEADPLYAWAMNTNPGEYWTPASLDVARSPNTGVWYENHAVANSDAGRAAALDKIASAVEFGADVPVTVTSNNGSSRAVLISDVRGSGSTQQFLVTDPSNGQTAWVSRQNIIYGNLGASGARMSAYWI